MQEYHALGLLVLFEELRIAMNDLIARRLGLLIKVEGGGRVFVGSRLQEVATSEEVEAAGWQLLSNLVVHGAFRHVGIEDGGRSVIHADAGGDADCGPMLLCLLGNGGDWGLKVLQNANGVVLGLYARSKSRASSSGVGDTVGSTLRGDKAHVREAGEEQGRRADAPFASSKIGFGTIHLVDAHTIANEIENVLRTGILFRCLLCVGCPAEAQGQRDEKDYSFHYYFEVFWFLSSGELRQALHALNKEHKAFVGIAPNWVRRRPACIPRSALPTCHASLVPSLALSHSDVG